MGWISKGKKLHKTTPRLKEVIKGSFRNLPEFHIPSLIYSKIDTSQEPREVELEQVQRRRLT